MLKPYCYIFFAICFNIFADAESVDEKREQLNSKSINVSVLSPQKRIENAQALLDSFKELMLPDLDIRLYKQRVYYNGALQNNLSKLFLSLIEPILIFNVDMQLLSRPDTQDSNMGIELLKNFFEDILNDKNPDIDGMAKQLADYENGKNTQKEEKKDPKSLSNLQKNESSNGTYHVFLEMFSSLSKNSMITHEKRHLKKVFEEFNAFFKLGLNLPDGNGYSSTNVDDLLTNILDFFPCFNGGSSKDILIKILPYAAKNLLIDYHTNKASKAIDEKSKDLVKKYYDIMFSNTKLKEPAALVVHILKNQKIQDEFLIYLSEFFKLKAKSEHDALVEQIKDPEKMINFSCALNVAGQHKVKNALGL